MPFDISIRHLRTFTVVAEESNVTRAAARLHLAQQAVSTQLQQLERAAGVALFVRTSRGVVLTPAGEAFLTSCRELVSELDAAVDRVQQIGRGGAGTLRVAFKAHSSAHFSPLVARALEDAVPPIAVEMISVASLDDELTLLREHRADAAYLWLPAGDPTLQCAEVLSEPRVVALAVDHRLANRSAVSLLDIADDPVVGPHGQLPADVMRFWLAEPRPVGVPAVRGPEASTTEECLHLVAQGRGVWIAPQSASRYFHTFPVSWVQITDASPAVLALAWVRGRDTTLVRYLLEQSRRWASTAHGGARDGSGSCHLE